MGVMRVGFNCATCHVGTYRTSKEAERQAVLGMPPQRLDFRLFLERMGECVLDPRFTADAVMQKVETQHPMGLVERTLYRHVAIPKVVAMTAYQTERHAFFAKRPPFGPGRFDALNFIRLDLDFDPGQDDHVGVVDYPSVWNQKARVNHYAQWDGSTPSVSERNRLAAMLAAGGDLECLDEDELRWHDEWLLTLPVPVYPFPVDETLAQRGEPIFGQHCADCHIEGGKRVGLPIDRDEIGTDPNRTDNLTPELGTALNELKTSRCSITQFRKSGGYASVLLDGVWARAPYLHNGSVPNLRELLEKPENRSKVFYRAYDVYDPKDVGFVSTGPDAEREGWKFDTTVKGNSNSGHLYGTDLSPEDKVALIEYIKLRDKNVQQP
jgi:mono/diheme cytochrome c family protein